MCFCFEAACHWPPAAIVNVHLVNCSPQATQCESPLLSSVKPPSDVKASKLLHLHRYRLCLTSESQHIQWALRASYGSTKNQPPGTKTKIPRYSSLITPTLNQQPLTTFLLHRGNKNRISSLLSSPLPLQQSHPSLTIFRLASPCSPSSRCMKESPL